MANVKVSGLKSAGEAFAKMMKQASQESEAAQKAARQSEAITKAERMAALAETERALPLRLARATPKTKQEIAAHAERVGRQMMGEHVRSGKPKETFNLAGRSMKENERIKQLEYELEATKELPPSVAYEPKIGDVNVAFPGDYTVSDVNLKSIQGVPIGSKQEGGSRYGLGKLDKDDPLFWASNEGPAQLAQDKITDVAHIFEPERVLAHHLAMGPTATNFAQHFADANLRAIDYSKLSKKDMETFDRIIAGGYDVKNQKTGKTESVTFPHWPGIADPEAAYAAMKADPELRKWFNSRMKTPKVTEATNMPNGLDVQWAITHPELRNMEVNLTGHSVGEMIPGAQLTGTAEHQTYSKGIRGKYLGHQKELTPFVLSFPDAAQHIASTKRPQDFTGTIQKIFPHQVVDQQYIDELGEYERQLRKMILGKKKGGAVSKVTVARDKDYESVYNDAMAAEINKANGGAIKPLQWKAEGGAMKTLQWKAEGGAMKSLPWKAAQGGMVPNLNIDNTMPDSSDSGIINYAPKFAKGGKAEEKPYIGYRSAGRRPESQQDRKASADIPLAVARGFVSGTLGMPGDIESLARLPYELITGNESPTILPTSEDIEKRLPFKSASETPVGRAFTGASQLAGGFYTGPLSGARAAMAIPKAVGKAGKDFVQSAGQPAANVIKPKGGNWLGGKIMGNISQNVAAQKPYKQRFGPLRGPDWLEQDLAGAEARLAQLKADPYPMQRMIEGQEQTINDIKKKMAVNDWVENNLGNYAKNQMGTPDDPIRKMFDKRTIEIEGKYAKDMERAKRLEDRAATETDPRRQANLMREAERIRMEAEAEREIASQHISHIPNRMSDVELNDPSLRERRQAYGFPGEGMGQSDTAKRWEALTDDSIAVMRAGDVQETKGILAKAQEAERAVKDKQLEVARKFDEHLRSVGLDEKEISILNEKTPIYDKAAIVKDQGYADLSYEYNKLRTDIRRDEFEAGKENPWIEKLNPETQLYFGNVNDLGFDHVIDILKQDVASGRIRPEQLSKVSIEDAVRRTTEFDREIAEKMAQASAKTMESFPVHKEYPQGYKWYELTAGEKVKPQIVQNETGGWDVIDSTGHNVGGFKSKEGAERALAQFSKNDPRFEEGYSKERQKALEEALENEGEMMGHCVGGYCPDVLSGKSRIFTLRGPKGEPHVTIETAPYGRGALSGEDLNAMEPGLFQKFLDQRYTEGGTDNMHEWLRTNRPEFAKAERIVQIKGKQNEAPVEKYLPFVQDFVKSGNWSDVGDLGNTGLFKADPEELGMFVPSDTALRGLPGRRTEYFQRAKEAGLFGENKYLTRQEWEDILRKQIESESGSRPSGDGMRRGGLTRAAQVAPNAVRGNRFGLSAMTA